MKLTQAFKDAKPQVAEIDDASLALALDLLYNPSTEQVSTVAAAPPEEPPRDPRALEDIRANYKTEQEFTEKYQPQINKLLDGIITLCDKPDLNKCEAQFTKLKANRAFNSPMSYSENEVSQYKIQNLVKCSLENIYYQMHHNKKNKQEIITPLVKNAIEASELDKCLPGAYTNIEDVRRKFAGELYSYKYDFMRNYASQYISDNKLSNPGNEVHYANELLYFTSLTQAPNSNNDLEYNTDLEYSNKGGYNIKVPNDLYARYPTSSDMVGEDPEFQMHREFAVQIDQLLTSPEGAQAFTEFVANNVIVNLPDLEDKNLTSADKTAMVNAALKTIDLNTGQIVAYNEDTGAMTYYENYNEIINIATGDYLSNLGENNQPALKLAKINGQGETKEIKEASGGYYIESEMIHPLSDYQTHYEKLLDISKISSLTIDNKKIPSFVDEKISAYKSAEGDNTPLGSQFYKAMDLDTMAQQYATKIAEYKSIDPNDEERLKAKADSITKEIGDSALNDILPKTDIYQKLKREPYRLDLPNIPIGANIEGLNKMQPYLNAVETIPNGIAQNMFSNFKTNLDFEGLAFIAKNYNSENTDSPNTAREILNAAIEDNNLSAASYILTSDEISTSISQDIKNDFLFDAVNNGKTSITKALITTGADVNVQNKDGETALTIAAFKGHLNIVNALIDSRADVNVQNEDGETALIMASQMGHLDIANELIEKGADVNIQNEYGNTALTAALASGHNEIVKALIEKGADVNLQDNEGQTLLMKAAILGQPKVAQELIEAGADFNIRDNNDQTALMMAAENGHAEIVKKLIEKGANVDLRNKDGKTALMMAAENGHAEIVKKLIEKGADINIKDEIGMTVLRRVAGRQDNTEVAKIIQQAQEAQKKVKENKGVALQNILNKQYILRPTDRQAHAPSGALEKPKINPDQKQR